jgi:hypothetical protein
MTRAEWFAFLKVNLKFDLCLALVLGLAAFFGGHH